MCVTVGSSREEAFRLGHQLAEEISAANPAPMKLKFEKVMQPCVLLAKKRYVGRSFERVDQAEGDFDAKGIETVRRDGSPFVAKASLINLIIDHCATCSFYHQITSLCSFSGDGKVSARFV